jgi:hypothetical protein
VDEVQRENQGTKDLQLRLMAPLKKLFAVWVKHQTKSPITCNEKRGSAQGGRGWFSPCTFKGLTTMNDPK